MEVEWTEINTALGQVAYLVVSIAHRFGFTFKRPFNLCGSMSVIFSSPNKEDNGKQPLYFTNNGNNLSEINRALSCLLLNIKDLQEKVNEEFKD